LTVLLMALAINSLAALSLALSLRGVWLGRQRLQHTTLIPAGGWAVAAVVLWTVAFGLSGAGTFPPPQQDALWYATALVALCPAIVVLGARRPGASVWNAFVIFPLLGVLGWPLLTLWAGGGEIRALRLETPQLIGFVLVLLMGAGNYIGTRFGLAAAAYVFSLCLLVGTVSAVAPSLVQGSSLARSLATICLGLAVVGARGVLREPEGIVDQLRDQPEGDAASTVGDDTSAAGSPVTAEVPTGFDLVWTDYRDTFGIVWAKRFQERLNGIAAQQKWPARLTDAGLEWEPDEAVDRDQVEGRIDQTFRWLLRRFVDPPWIDERLNQPATSRGSKEPADSEPGGTDPSNHCQIGQAPTTNFM
jgi:hypothetical protein